MDLLCALLGVLGPLVLLGWMSCLAAWVLACDRRPAPKEAAEIRVRRTRHEYQGQVVVPAARQDLPTALGLATIRVTPTGAAHEPGHRYHVRPDLLPQPG